MKKLVKRAIKILALLVLLWITGHLIALKIYDYRCQRVMDKYPIANSFLELWCR